MSPILSIALQATNELQQAAAKARHRLMLTNEALVRIGLRKSPSALRPIVARRLVK